MTTGVELGVGVGTDVDLPVTADVDGVGRGEGVPAAIDGAAWGVGFAAAGAPAAPPVATNANTLTTAQRRQRLRPSCPLSLLPLILLDPAGKSTTLRPSSDINTPSPEACFANVQRVGSRVKPLKATEPRPLCNQCSCWPRRVNGTLRGTHAAKVSGPRVGRCGGRNCLNARRAAPPPCGRAADVR